MTKDDEKIIAIHEHQKRLKHGITEEKDKDILVIDVESGICVRVGARCVRRSETIEKILQLQVEWGEDYDYVVVNHGDYHIGSIYKI